MLSVRNFFLSTSPVFMRWLFSCWLLFCWADTIAQNTRFPDIISTTTSPLPEKAIYRFQSFTEGTVIFRNGLIASQLFNYDIAHDQMHFINQQGVVLAISNPDSISFISLNGSRFYYSDGYLQSISTTSGLVLAFRQSVNVLPQAGKENDPRLQSATSPSRFFNVNGQQFMNAADGSKISVMAYEQYFLGEEGGHFKRANKTIIKNYWKADKTAIEAFIKTYHTNFNKLNDLLELLQYCASLDR